MTESGNGQDKLTLNSQSSAQAVNKTELTMALDEVELLIAYLSRNGKTLESHLLESTFNIRNQFAQEGKLASEVESKFWINYRILVQMVYPATVSSIIDTCPTELWRRKFPKRTQRVKRIPVYYGVAVFLLIIFTVGLQTYSMIGAGVLHKTYELFNERNQVRIELKQLQRLIEVDPSNSQSNQFIELEKEEQRLDQEFDANRVLLYDWNDMWQFGAATEINFSLYDDYQYQHSLNALDAELKQLQQSNEDNQKISKQERKRLQKALIKNEEAQHALNKKRKLDESRNRFFTERLSAVYVVNLLEQYVLPLLFGCLGAFTLVLRTIHQAFQKGTFTFKNTLDYNIRIVLGGVTGISSGMFFSDNTGLPSGQFGPMLVAFIVGYNVEILFMVMDDLASRLSSHQKSEPSKPLKESASEDLPSKG